MSPHKMTFEEYLEFLVQFFLIFFLQRRKTIIKTDKNKL